MIKLEDLYFVHIPKNAGTSIEEEGLLHGLKWGRHYFNCQLHKHMEKNGKLRRFATWHFPNSVLKYPTTSECCFCVVRNPYTRIISDYNYHVKMFPHFKDMGLNEFISLALNSFWEDNHCLDNHIRPQINFVFDSGTQVVKNILKFENLSEEFECLTGVALTKKENVSKPNGLTVDDISDRNILLINYFYYEDFKKFGYQFLNRI